MSGEADAVLKAISDKSKITTLPGTFVSYDATGFVVDVGGGRIPAKLGSDYLPEVNEPVWVWFVDGTPFVMGPTVPKPGRGTVVSVTSGLVTLSTDVGDVIIPYAASLTPTAGQVLQIDWRDGGFAIAVMSTSPVGGTAPPPPGGGGGNHSDVFTAIDAGSYGSGRWWTNQVWSSDNNIGAWFYGTKIRDTIPASAIIQRVEIYISPQQISGSAPNFGLHSYGGNPGFSPSIVGATAVGVGAGWVTLPAGFGDSLKSGGGYFGIGVLHGGYSIFSSLASDGQSGALRITSAY